MHADLGLTLLNVFAQLYRNPSGSGTHSMWRIWLVSVWWTSLLFLIHSQFIHLRLIHIRVIYHRLEVLAFADTSLGPSLEVDT